MTVETPRGPDTPRPLRVALFSGNYNYTADGANMSLNRLVDHLQGKGVQVRVYSPTSPHPAFPPVGELVSVPSIALPRRSDYRLALGMPPTVRRDVRAFEPDLIHLSAPDLLGAAARRLARSMGVPVVASVHTHFDSYLDYYALGWLRPWVRRRVHAFYRACDYVLAPTAAIAEQLRIESVPARVRIWSRGVDTQRFSPAHRCQEWRRAQGLDPERPVIAFLGRIVMEKGLAVFVETIRRLERTGAPMQVVVIGDGPARDWFAQRLPGAVFTGFLDGDALSTALASADILLNPSCTETLGNVNLEAMASGLALVCADAPNTRALMRDGANARLCPGAEPRAFCQAIEALIADPAERARLGREAREQSLAYRWGEIMDAVVDVYQEALAGRRAVGARHVLRGPWSRSKDPPQVASHEAAETLAE